MWCTQPGSVGVRRGIGPALLVREDGDQAAVARIEVEVALGRVVQVRLLEHERHAEHALPEVDRRLPVGADDRDVVDALALELPHSCAGKDYSTAGPPACAISSSRRSRAGAGAAFGSGLRAAASARARSITAVFSRSAPTGSSCMSERMTAL